MTDRQKNDEQNDRSAEKVPKPAGQDVGPPEERVDDEVGSDESKTTTRQE